MSEIAEALALLLRSGEIESLRIEAVIKPRPPTTPPEPMVFRLGPVRTKD